MNHSSPNCPKYVWRTNIRPVKNGLKTSSSTVVLLLGVGPEEHNLKATPRTDPIPCPLPLFLPQSLNGTCSPWLFIQPLHSSPFRVDYPAVFTTCSMFPPLISLNEYYILLLCVRQPHSNEQKTARRFCCTFGGSAKSYKLV